MLQQKLSIDLPGEIEHGELKDHIIHQYKVYFHLLKDLLAVHMPHITGLDKDIVSMQRGVYSDTQSPIFFDYFSSTHNMYCEQHMLPINDTKRLYKVIFAGGYELIFSLGTRKRGEKHRNIFFLEDLLSRLSKDQRNQLDVIFNEIIKYEYAYFSQLRKKHVIHKTIDHLEEAL